MGNRHTNPETMDGQLVVLVATDDQQNYAKVYGPFESEAERWDLADSLRRKGFKTMVCTMVVPFSD